MNDPQEQPLSEEEQFAQFADADKTEVAEPVTPVEPVEEEQAEDEPFLGFNALPEETRELVMQ